MLPHATAAESWIRLTGVLRSRMTQAEARSSWIDTANELYRSGEAFSS